MKWKEFNYADWEKENAGFNHDEYESDSKKILEEAVDIEDLEGLLKIPRPPWKPSAFYNKDGNILRVILSEEDSYAHWVCPGIELMLSFETHEIVGIIISDVTNLIEEEE